MRLKNRQLAYNAVTLLLGSLLTFTLYSGRPASLPGQSCVDRALRARDLNPARLFIGVMTTRKHLATRAAAIMETWGRQRAARLVFYIGRGHHAPGVNDTKSLHVTHTERVELVDGLPVVQLEGIGDQTYPPRAKCYAMMHHMHLNFGTHFRWFVRADDDVYLRTDHLVRFLQSLDHNRPSYIGHPGFGIAAEKGRLGLEPGQPYCLGGPGVLFSALTLGLLVPHLAQCAQSAVTSHEDTELGLCIWKHLRLACTSDQRIKKLFYQNYDQKKDYTRVNNMANAVSVHPVKDPADMRRLHVSFSLLRLRQLEKYRQQVASMVTEVDRLTGGAAQPETSPGGQEDLQHRSHNDRQQRDVHRFVARKVDGADQRSIDGGPTGEDLDIEALTLEVKQEDNPVWSYAVFNKQTGVVNTLDKNPWRVDMMKNTTRYLVLTTRKYYSHVPGAGEIRAQYQSYTTVQGPQHWVCFSYNGGYLSFLVRSHFRELEWHEVRHLADDAEDLSASLAMQTRLTTPTDIASKPKASPASQWPQLFVLLPLSGRHGAYLSFLDHLANAASRYPACVQLRVALYPDSEDEHELTLAASRKETRLSVTVVDQTSQFSRAQGLNAVVSGLNDDAILVVIDVDLVMSSHFLQRSALNTVPGRAYFPIMFSQYSPSTVCYGSADCEPKLRDFSDDAGFWRYFSYGMLAMTAGDFRMVGGFDTNITGWGKEDVEFYERCLTSGLQVLRSPDEGLIHQFHDKTCDPSLPGEQLDMCLGSRDALMGSSRKLSEIVTALGISTETQQHTSAEGVTNNIGAEKTPEKEEALKMTR